MGQEALCSSLQVSKNGHRHEFHLGKKNKQSAFLWQAWGKALGENLSLKLAWFPTCIRSVCVKELGFWNTNWGELGKEYLLICIFTHLTHSLAQYHDNMYLWSSVWTAPHWSRRYFAVLAVPLLLNSLSLIFPCAEYHQDVHWIVWQASHSAVDSRKARKNPQPYIWFDRSKQHELVTYEKWQIGHVVNCETNSTEYSFNITSAMYKTGYVLTLFSFF